MVIENLSTRSRLNRFLFPAATIRELNLQVGLRKEIEMAMKVGCKIGQMPCFSSCGWPPFDLVGLAAHMTLSFTFDIRLILKSTTS
jgi:hypothetical protein